jgi:hypothetical protein
LNLEKKVWFLKNLQEIVKPNDFWSKPDTKWKAKPWDITDDLKLKSFEEKITKWEKITPRERWEYLTLLRGIKK